MGIHTTFTQEKADHICEQLAEGVPLREICREPGMPAWRTVYQWREVNAAFDAAIARARIAGFDAIAEEALGIADDASNDYMLRRKRGDEEGEGDKMLDAEHVQRSKLRIETRLKLLAKWDPKRYGDKVQTELTGPNGGPVQASVTVEFMKKEP